MNQNVKQNYFLSAVFLPNGKTCNICGASSIQRFSLKEEFFSAITVKKDKHKVGSNLFKRALAHSKKNHT